MSEFSIPRLCLIVLIGPSSAGKSTFARRHFSPTEIVSSDRCRAMITDDENALDAHEETFALLHLIVARRLERGLLTVVDATNLHPEDRAAYIRLAREYFVRPVAIVFDMPEPLLQQRNTDRPDRSIPDWFIRRQHRQGQVTTEELQREGFRQIIQLRSAEASTALQVRRTPLPSDHRHEHGPFDIIGDVHGCYDELIELLATLGYDPESDPAGGPEGHRLIFVGDLVDRGPASDRVLRLVQRLTASGLALCVPGNHDDKLMRYLRGSRVQLRHGLEKTAEQLAGWSDAQKTALAEWLAALPSHLQLDDGKLLVAHAGLEERMHGRSGRAVRSYCLYGPTTDEPDETGLPVRLPWFYDYEGQAAIVYGHTPVTQPAWINRTINIDTGCVFGGRLTALRYPSNELVSVPARQVYAVPSRPPDTGFSRRDHWQVPTAGQLQGRHSLTTHLYGQIGIRPHQSAAALDRLSHSAADPRWLVYLPPVPVPATDGRTEAAIGYYRQQEVDEVLLCPRPAGVEVIIILGRDPEAAGARFGLQTPAGGQVLTRTGRPFFADEAMATAALAQLRQALDQAGFWERQRSGWLIFDGYWAQKLTPQLLLAAEGERFSGRETAWHLDQWSNWFSAEDSLIELPQYQRRSTAADAGPVPEHGHPLLIRPDHWPAFGRRGLLPPLFCTDPAGQQEQERRIASLAIRQHALGLEALHRFVQHQPLRRVYRSVFGILALDSEPVSPSR